MSVAQLSAHVEALAARGEVTPLVSEVANDTAVLLEEVVVTAVLHEHTVDEALLTQTFAPFAQLEAQRQASAEELERLAAEASALSSEHLTCRAAESAACAETTGCNAIKGSLAEALAGKEAVLTAVDGEIYANGCPSDASHLQPEFRTAARERFTRYNAALDELETAQAAFGAQDSECGRLTELQDNSRGGCDAVQLNLEQVVCSHINTLDVAGAEYYEAFARAREAFDSTKASVQVMESDRKVEFTTLQRVVCLLRALVHTEDGDTSSDENRAALDRCHELAVDTSPLDLVYLDTPDAGELPAAMPAPCSPAFDQLQYTGLPECTTVAACTACSEPVVITQPPQPQVTEAPETQPPPTEAPATGTSQ